MYVIGTAGHVDHGKSELVRALTGIHPDRLPEEQARQMTIDLGFAWVDLPENGTVGIVDVPGHIDFIENMLSGAGMIDAVLLVIAADEGVMPQTREHLAILDLLAIKRAIVVLSKCDLVDDPAWLDLVELDVHELLEKTSFEGSTIVRTSAVRTEGIDLLQQQLDRLLSDTVPKRDLGRPRLHLDRIFTLSGFGTVVTGTLLDGSLSKGDDVIVTPGNVQGRIRTLQSHHREVDIANPGTRVAVNLSGIHHDEIHRGDTMILPGTYEETTLLDTRLSVLPGTRRAVKHNQSLKLFAGAAQRIARIRVLGEEEIAPGASGLAQLVLNEPILVARGDRFILRQASPAETLAGGEVLNPHPHRKHRRFDDAILKGLDRLGSGTLEILTETVNQYGPVTLEVLVPRSGLDPEAVPAIVDEMVERAKLVPIQAGESEGSQVYFVTEEGWQQLLDKMRRTLEIYHQRFPLRPGMPGNEVRSKVSENAALFEGMVKRAVDEGLIARTSDQLYLKEHAPRPSEAQNQALDGLIVSFQRTPATPPSMRECLQYVDDELLQYAINAGILVRVSQDVLFLASTYNEFCGWIRDTLSSKGQVSVKDFRDQFGSTRKFSIAFLEHLNRLGLTRFEDDHHVPLLPVREWEIDHVD